MLHLSGRAIGMLVGNLPSFWPVLNWVFTYTIFLPLFPDLHSGICLETSPLNHTFQKSNYVPSDACTRFGCLKSCLFLQSQESLLAVLSSMLNISPGAKDETDPCNLGSTRVCHQPTGLGCSWNANRIQGRPPEFLQQTERESLQITTTLTPKEFGAQKVFLYQTRIGDCREVSETDTDLIWEVKPFYSWNCSAAHAVLTWADCNCQDCFLLSSHFPESHYPISMESH